MICFNYIQFLTFLHFPNKMFSKREQKVHISETLQKRYEIKSKVRKSPQPLPRHRARKNLGCSRDVPLYTQNIQENKPNGPIASCILGVFVFIVHFLSTITPDSVLSGRTFVQCNLTYSFGFLPLKQKQYQKLFIYI